MAKPLEFLWVIVFLFPNPLLSQLDEFVYNGFKNSPNNNINNLTVTGAAEIENNGVLRLTTDEKRLIGHAFYPVPIQFKNPTTRKPISFSTAFAFSIITRRKNNAGHGLAFTISPEKVFPASESASYLGILSPDTIGKPSNHLFAVEFDIVQDLALKDISDNHVGVDVNSLISNASVNACQFVEHLKRDLDLRSGKTIQAWIDYNSTSDHLNVSLSLSSTKPSSPILSIPLDLSQIFKDTMFVGFSASTGLLSSYHYVHGWSFKMNGEAKSLSLNSLPSPKLKQSNTAFTVGVSASTFAFIAFAIVVAFYVIRRIKKSEVVEDWELNLGPHRFSYKELEQATKGFRDEELLGFGGFGRVYKGSLPNSNTQIAVKRISHDSKQGLREFVSEIASIGRLRHRNLVQLLGWCRNRGDLLLVYDFMPNGSLDKYIFDEPKSILSWEQRFKIIKGVGSGLLYLHEEWEESVIHRDVKSANVLIDSELNGRLGDFGLAKMYNHGSDPTTTRVVGTLGYLAPELTRTGKPTTSSDVFAFGALLLEVVCGRRPIEVRALPEEMVLVDWVWERWQEGAVMAVVDPRLGGEFDEGEVVVVVKLGLMCSNNVPGKRPSMRQVVGCLEGEVGLSEVVAPPEEKGCGFGSCSGIGDLMGSFSSSYFEKASFCSSCAGGGDGGVDVELGHSSPSPSVVVGGR